MVSITDESPYVYPATAFFALSAFSSDLLVIRASLTLGFLFLVLAAVSGFSLNGSFSSDTLPFQDGQINIPMIINACLFFLNLFICLRLIGDEIFRKPSSDEEHAIFRFFQSRCGLTPLEFQQIVRHGQFMDLDADKQVPNVQSTLYLVLEGKIQCQTKFQENRKEVPKFCDLLCVAPEVFDLMLYLFLYQRRTLIPSSNALVNSLTLKCSISSQYPSDLIRLSFKPRP